LSQLVKVLGGTLLKLLKRLTERGKVILDRLDLDLFNMLQMNPRGCKPLLSVFVLPKEILCDVLVSAVLFADEGWNLEAVPYSLNLSLQTG
jgi:hypothetical protein